MVPQYHRCLNLSLESVLGKNLVMTVYFYFLKFVQLNFFLNVVGKQHLKLVANQPKSSVDCYQNALGCELVFFMDLIFTENVDQNRF